MVTELYVNSNPRVPRSAEGIPHTQSNSVDLRAMVLAEHRGITITSAVCGSSALLQAPLHTPCVSPDIIGRVGKDTFGSGRGREGCFKGAPEPLRPQ